MRFPGQRNSKHYFPLNKGDPLLAKQQTEDSVKDTHIVGIDQTMVELEAPADRELLEKYGLSRGHSLVIPDDKAEQLYCELQEHRLIQNHFAGGTIANTLHNYSMLSDDTAILLGVMCRDISIGSYAYRYLCNTSSRVDLDYLQPVDGPIARCFSLIAEDGERTFAINTGMMNQLEPASIPEHVVKGASALVLTAYLMRCAEGDPIPDATMRAVGYAKEHGVPVVLTLGTKYVIEDRPEFWRQFATDHVNVLAMNEEEATALTGYTDPLLATDKALDYVDIVLCTAGPAGLYMGGYTDIGMRRKTRHALLPGEIPEFNQYEFSRPMLKARCETPVRVYSHIAPYLGGPKRIRNTNGAGDAALSALLHDMAANRYHRGHVPNSSKHIRSFLTYSSFAQVCKYANRVSYEVLATHSPRLSRGLPEKEDGLEEVYWAR